MRATGGHLDKGTLGSILISFLELQPTATRPISPPGNKVVSGLLVAKASQAHPGPESGKQGKCVCLQADSRWDQENMVPAPITALGTLLCNPPSLSPRGHELCPRQL